MSLPQRRALHAASAKRGKKCAKHELFHPSLVARITIFRSTCGHFLSVRFRNAFFAVAFVYGFQAQLADLIIVISFFRKLLLILTTLPRLRRALTLIICCWFPNSVCFHALKKLSRMSSELAVLEVTQLILRHCSPKPQFSYQAEITGILSIYIVSLILAYPRSSFRPD